MEAIKNMDIDLIGMNEGKRKDSNNPGEKDNNNWTTVNNKKTSKMMTSENIASTMQKVRVTMTIRAPKDTKEFTPAKIHTDILHEIHKFDETLLVFNSKGDIKVNIKAPLSETRYKDLFKPVEKHHALA
jgi:hypothetical protein